MDNVKEALAILQETVVFERDKEIQGEIKKAINKLQQELHDRQEASENVSYVRGDYNIYCTTYER